MNWIDISLVLIILLAVFAGWYRGFISSALGLLTWIGSFIIAFLFYPYVAGLLDKIFDAGPWLLPLAFLLTAIVAGFISRTIPIEAHHNGMNRILGIIPGAITGYLYAIILSALFLAFPLRDGITEEIRESRLGVQFAMQSEWANRKLAPVFDEAIRQTITSLTVRPDS